MCEGCNGANPNSANTVAQHLSKLNNVCVAAQFQTVIGFSCRRQENVLGAANMCFVLEANIANFTHITSEWFYLFVLFKIPILNPLSKISTKASINQPN